MATAVDIACPNCKKELKIPTTVIGKKVKCKYCEHTFVVPNPDDDDSGEKSKPAKPTKPGAKPAASSPPPPAAPAPEEKKSPFLDDDDEPKVNIQLITDNDEVARCPHCAKELDPPDAKVCIHCGFNNLTRTRAETKKVWAPTAEDWIMHLLPGIIAVIICVTLIVLDVICYQKMREWLTGSFLDMEEKDAAGRQKFYVAPGFFICLVFAASLAIFVPSVKFAVRRLAKEYMPPEKIKS
jgi:hypothetical protein